MPAPNAGAIPPNHPDLQRLAETFTHRARCVLAIAAHETQRALVLGAWGCGVFRNDPTQVARIFHTLLLGPENWSAWFRNITFAILDHSPDQSTFKVFANTFA
jgi:uncharacterized protein (TIGR02452 family)